MSDATYQPGVYRKQGGNELVVSATGTLTIETGGNVIQPVAAITAAGSTIADAAALTGNINVVSGANIDKGVLLPAGTAGQQLLVINTGAGTNTLKLYPNVAANLINGVSNTAVVIGGTSSALAACTAAGTWWTLKAAT